MTKEVVAKHIVEILEGSGLGYDDQVKAISMARVGIQPRAGIDAWRSGRKPIAKPGEKRKAGEAK